MYKYILQEGGNINWMALFALLTFFIVFLGSIIITFFSSKSFLKKMSHLPLEDSNSLNMKIESGDEK